MDPKQFVLNFLKNNQNSMLSNLMQMIENGSNQNVETFARNLFSEKGRDFDKEFAEFKKTFSK